MGPGPESSVVRFGAFEADLTNGLLCRQGIRVKLQEQSFRILALLLERPGQVVTREAIRQALWPDGTFVDFEGGLNADMKKLRVALNDASEHPEFIETIPKRGYRFIAPVNRAMPENTPSVPGAVPASSQARQGVPASRQRIAAVFGIGMLVFAVIGYVAYVRHSPKRSPADVTEATIKPVASRRSIAVLGFYNVSGNPEDLWLGTALSEMVSTELAEGDKLRLIPSEDVANLRLASPWSHTDTLAQATTSRIGAALNSDLLLLGSYTRVEDRVARQLRVDVRLQDARSGEILLEAAETGDRQNLFELVSQIGGIVREKLGATSPPAEAQSDVFASMPSNREAARFYALGLDKFHQFDYLAAAELLEQSVKADPNFPLSHSVLSNVWHDLGYGQKAKDEAQRALDLCANLPQTKKLLISGQYHVSAGKMVEAAADYRSLYAFYPDCIDCGLFLAAAQIQSGRPLEALATLQSLRKLPPPSSEDPRIDFNEQLAVSTYDRPRQYELLESTARKAAERGQKLLYARARLAECSNLLFVGRPNEAMAACEEARALFEILGDRAGVARTLLILAARQSDAGDQETSLRTLKKALQISDRLGGVELAASIQNGIGNTYERMGRLEQAAGSFREARKRFEQSGNRHGISAAAVNLGDVLASMGKFREAEDAYQGALQIEHEASPASGCYPLYSIAILRLATGDLKAANERIDSALKACEVQKVARHNAFAIGVLGDILKAEDRLPEAQQKYEEALAIYAKADAQDLIPGMQMDLASVLLEQGRAAEAEKMLNDLLAALEQKKDRAGTSAVLMLLSRALQMQGRLDQARENLLRAEQLSRGLSDWALAVHLSVQRARLAAGSQNDRESLQAARAHLQSSILSMRRIGDYDLECEGRLALGALELEDPSFRSRTQLEALAKETHERGFKLIYRKASEMLNGNGHPGQKL